MRISDWSSDVCSSDLGDAQRARRGRAQRIALGELRIGERRGDIDREAAVGGKAHRSLRRNAALARARLQRRDLEPARGEAALQLHIRQPRAERLVDRSEEHTSELQSLMRISYAVF